MLLREECERLRAEVEVEAAELALMARAKARAHRQSLHEAAARKLLKERRSPELDKLPAAIRLDGVYEWPLGPPVAGKRAFLAYNLTQAPIKMKESVKRAPPALLSKSNLIVHVGYDGWWNKASKVYNLAPLTEEELKDMNLGPATATATATVATPATAAAGGKQGGVGGGREEEWWGAWIDIPLSAYVLNFVLSNKERDAWDNHEGKDFHTLVVDGFDDEQLLEALTSSIASDKEAEDKEAEDRAASRAMKKVRTKVSHKLPPDSSLMTPSPFTLS